MAKPCSLDLRERVVAAVEQEGMSRNAAAARFGAAVNSAIKWVARFRATGSAAPRRAGQDGPTQAQDVARCGGRMADRPLPGAGLHDQPAGGGA